MKVASWLGHRARELRVHARRISQKGNLRLVIFPSDLTVGSAGDLRGRAVGWELMKLGYRVTLVPPQLELSQRRRILRLERPDFILMQQTRHPLNVPSLYPDHRCILDVDDADILDPACSAEVIRCASSACGVVAGSRFIAQAFRPYVKRIQIIWTSCYLPPTPQSQRLPRRENLVSWPTSSVAGCSVEAELVRDVAIKLRERREFELRLYGMRGGKIEREYCQSLQQANIPTQTFGWIEYPEFVRSLSEVTVAICPLCDSNPFSRGKSFGKVLACMAAPTPMVLSSAVDYPLFFSHGNNGMLVNGTDVGEWVDSVLSLLDSAKKRERICDQAASDYMARLTTAKAARLTDSFLRSLLI